MINPAYTGSRDVGSFFGLHRSQWVGIKGAPRTSEVSFHTPLKNNHLGLGVSIFHESLGPETKNFLMIDASYTLNLEKSKLAFGLKGTLGFYNIDFNKLDIEDRNDWVFTGGTQNLFAPNIGAGIYWYSNNYYVGVSVPNLLQTELHERNQKQISIVKNTQHYHIIAGYVFNLKENIKFKPSILSKVVQGSPIQLDISGNFMFNDRFVVGAAWRWSAAVSGLAGFQINKNWFIGYAYDFETTDLTKYNSGSHEIFLRYELLSGIKKIMSPRFF